MRRLVVVLALLAAGASAQTLAWDGAALRDSLAGVIERHGSLRTTFAVGEDGVPVQRVPADTTFDLPSTDLSHLDHAHRVATLN